jgi:hypothetical protein
VSRAFQPRKPLFNLGDRVIVTVTGVHRDRNGIVVEVITPRAGDVYRYRVRFTDGTTGTFFGFELESRPPAK